MAGVLRNGHLPQFRKNARFFAPRTAIVRTRIARLLRRRVGVLPKSATICPSARRRSRRGEVPERFKGTVLKTVLVATPAWVRIPPSPPDLSVKRAVNATSGFSGQAHFSRRTTFRTTFAAHKAGTPRTSSPLLPDEPLLPLRKRCIQNPANLLRCLFLHRGEHVRIGVQRNADRAVPEPFGDDLGMHALRQ